MLITLYGVNNIGKSTQAKLLCQKLTESGYKVFYLKYPIYDLEPSGPIINSQLRDPNTPKMSELELQTWFFLNRLEFEPKLLDLLATNDFVIAEDYSQTGISWGTAKGVSETWLTQLNSVLRKEELAILLTGERFLEGKEAGHIHEENSELIDKCQEILFRRALEQNWLVTEVTPGVQETFERLWEQVAKKI